MVAKNHVAKFDANYGGTEIYEPLRAIFKKPIGKDVYRQVDFKLTRPFHIKFASSVKWREVGWNFHSLNPVHAL